MFQGLDSLSAMDIVTTARDIANIGKAVIMSLVQPSQALFEKFDYVLLMSRGACAYWGPVSDVQDYFESGLGCNLTHTHTLGNANH